MRARIDGELRDLADDIALAKTHKHTIEVVVDRLVIRAGIETRLADSLGVAFKYGDDVVKVEVLGEQRRRRRSRRCSSASASPARPAASPIPEITPRLFSFNNPHGACPTCSGLGTTIYFDPELIVPDERSRWREGAVAPWEKRDHSIRAASARSGLARHF